MIIPSLKTLHSVYRSRVVPIVPERFFIKRMFRLKLGYELDLENPQTFNEKISWLKLNERNPLQTLCADKYAVRNYVREKIGEQYLIPLLYHTDNPDDIVSENLPDVPHIIKANHNSGGAVVITDKSKVDFAEVRKSLREQLGRNYYHLWKEWQYKNIKPRIVVEKLLLDGSNIPNDYKFHCFNGKVEFIQVDLERFTEHKRNLYDLDWNLMDCRWIYENGPAVEKPPALEQMIVLAETIAKDFRLVRVDFYTLGSSIYFGEITFHPETGMGVFYPSEWDKKLGDRLAL